MQSYEVRWYLHEGLVVSLYNNGKVLLNESDPINKDMECIQKVQNKLLRLLTNTRLLDMVSTATLQTKPT